MTNAELRKLLEQYPDNDEIFFYIGFANLDIKPDPVNIHYHKNVLCIELNGIQYEQDEFDEFIRG